MSFITLLPQKIYPSFKAPLKCPGLLKAFCLNSVEFLSINTGVLGTYDKPTSIVIEFSGLCMFHACVCVCIETIHFHCFCLLQGLEYIDIDI